MKIDFHVHTAPLSRAALHGLEDALRAARECGLDGIVLTETNVVRSAAALMFADDLARKRYGLTVFQGLYLQTTLGPLLVYGQSVGQSGLHGIRIESRPDTAAAIDYCLDHGWAVVVAAPFRYGVGPDEGVCHRFKRAADPVAEAHREVGFLLRKCHAVEINGCATKQDNDFAEALAEKFNLPLVVGSGACYPTQLRPGCWTKVPGSTRTSDQLASVMAEAARHGTENELLRPAELRGIYSTGRGRGPVGPVPVQGDAQA